MAMGLGLSLDLLLGADIERCWTPFFGASGREISIPPWLSSAGSTIAMEMQFVADTGNRYQLVICDNRASASWFGLEYGKFNWDSAAYSEVRVNGVVITRNTVDVNYGVDYVISLTLNAGRQIGILGNGYTSGTWFMIGGIREITMIDSGDDRHYHGIIKKKGAAPTTLEYLDSNPGAKHGTLVSFPADWVETSCSPLSQYTYTGEYGIEYQAVATEIVPPIEEVTGFNVWQNFNTWG